MILPTKKNRMPGNQRIFEWACLLLLVAVIIAVLVDKGRDIQGRAEFAAVQTTLGALRVSLVLEQMRVVSGGGHGTLAPVTNMPPPNPFAMLAKYPKNYAGEMSLADARALGNTLPRGTWSYDRKCPCIGYRPMNERQFAALSGGELIVFEIRSESAAETNAPPSILAAREPYWWFGELIQ